MRVALISDIHGNEIALEAVLQDAATLGYDALVCLGDVANLGPKPVEVIERLQSLGCPCILGNHDEFLLRPELVRQYTESPEVVSAVDWTRARLSKKHLDFLRTFPRTVELPLPGGATMFLYHGTPESNMEGVTEATPATELDRLLNGRQPTVAAGGHTHVQMFRQHEGICIVNPGSVGLSFAGHPGAGCPPTILPRSEYAIVEAVGNRVSVNLRRVLLDWRTLVAEVEATDIPVAHYQIGQYTAAAGR